MGMGALSHVGPLNGDNAEALVCLKQVTLHTARHHSVWHSEISVLSLHGALKGLLAKSLI